MTESAADKTPLLEVRNLTTVFPARTGDIAAVNDVSLKVPRGQVVAIVGESGSGKSTLGLSILNLVPPPGKVVSGDVMLDGRSLRGLSTQRLRHVRGSEIAMVFQDPLTALNPAFTVGSQIAEVIRVHERISRRDARSRALDALRAVQIPDPVKRSRQYPHELSGGMRQRCMIAMALSLKPKLLVADEPTTALDVTIEAQILELLVELQREFHMGVMFITHDLAVVARIADFIAVMYAGQVVEQAPSHSIFSSPFHPYTVSLLESVPHREITDESISLRPIPGNPPSAGRVPPGCPFHPRCFLRRDRGICQAEVPTLRAMGAQHASACHFAEELSESNATPGVRK